MNTYEAIVDRVLKRIDKEESYINTNDLDIFNYLKDGDLDLTFQFNHRNIQRNIFQKIKSLDFNDLKVINSKFNDRKYIADYISRRNQGQSSESFLTPEIEKSHKRVFIGYATVYLKVYNREIYEDTYYDEFKYKIGVPIYARKFIKIWEDFVNEKLKNRLSAFTFDNYVFKTETVLGKPGYLTTDSPLGDFILSKLDFHKYFKEDDRIDFSFVFNLENTYNGIFDYYPNKDKVINLPEIHKLYDILLEHENKIDYSHQEMIKLCHLKSPLKVLITYNWDEEESEDYSYSYDIAKENFSKIISQSNDKFRENDSTEYLLIIGQKTLTGYYWNYTIFNINGSQIFTTHRR